MNNPFRTKEWCDYIQHENKLTENEFTTYTSDANGISIQLSEINEMIAAGIITVDFNKLEDFIAKKTLIH